MKNYVLSPRAQFDIAAIWDYTVAQWGIDQAENYVRALQSAIEVVAAKPNRGETCDDIRTGYYKYPAGAHVLFYRLKGVGIDVVRILHRRMDFDRHL